MQSPVARRAEERSSAEEYDWNSAAASSGGLAGILGGMDRSMHAGLTRTATTDLGPVNVTPRTMDSGLGAVLANLSM